MSRGTLIDVCHAILKIDPNDRTPIESLLSLLEDPQQRSKAVSLLLEFDRENAALRAFAEANVSFESEKDLEVDPSFLRQSYGEEGQRRGHRLHAAGLLWKLDPDPAKVVPVLIEELLTAGREDVIGALGEVGPDASVALPWLVRIARGVSPVFLEPRLRGDRNFSINGGRPPPNEIIVRLSACEAVWSIAQDEAAIRPFLRRLLLYRVPEVDAKVGYSGPQPVQRQRAARLLCEIGPTGEEILLEGMEHEDALVRAVSAEAFAETTQRSPRVTAALQRLVDDESPCVAQMAEKLTADR